MTAALDQLTSLIPPPAKPLYADGDWSAVEAEFGPLPAEWKAFIRTYGSGVFLGPGELTVHNPLDRVGKERIATDLDILRDESENNPPGWTVHPVRPGYLPWGGDDHGSVFSFWTAGEPDDWVTAGNIEDIHRRFDCGLATFLLGTLARIGPSRWYDAVFAQRERRTFDDVRRVRSYPADQTDFYRQYAAEFPD